MPHDNKRSRSRSRSRSPSYHKHSSHHRRPRSRSPHRSKRHYQGSRHIDSSKPAATLPLDARPISKHDLQRYRPMFALYLDIQKQRDIEDLSEDEVKGRWKSFVGKWNRGELAEGWYDSQTLEKAVTAEASNSYEEIQGQSESRTRRARDVNPEDGGEDDDGDDYGPSLPTGTLTAHPRSATDSQLQGPHIPSMQDLRARTEQLREESDAQYEERLQSIRLERRLARKQQQEQLNDIVPRAEAGTRDRQLERKREVADSNRAFAAAKDIGGDVELPDQEVLGDEDSLGQLRKMQKEAERKKNDREIRREEALRSRVAEREVRMRGMREKEEKTMGMLREIAKARFGAG